LESSSLCVVDATGQIVREAKVASEPDILTAWFQCLGIAPSRIGLGSWTAVAMAVCGDEASWPGGRLLKDGFVSRYDTTTPVDGLADDEGVFLACSFWLADNYILQDRYDDARTLFQRLLALRNDLGLLAEEYDPKAKRLVGNFPQAFSYVALINTAHSLTRAFGPAQHRAVSGETAGAGQGGGCA